MSGRGPTLVFAIVAALAAAALAVVVATSSRDPAEASRSERFQALMGGLGGGASVDLARCARAFDPRLDDGCTYRLHPVPAGGAYCAHGLAGLPGR